MTHPQGRQPIGVNQPPYSGTNYPFVDPSSDIQYLLGDLYLSYEDDNCELALPFSVSRLYGFDSSQTPGPANNYDIIISDVDGRTVFDSTVLDPDTSNPLAEYAERTWDNRLLIIEWVMRAVYDSGGDRTPTTGSAVCRVVAHTEWSPDDAVVTYAADIQPTDGELDSRAYTRVPKRVRSIYVGTTRITADNLRLEAGNNIDLSPASTAEGGLELDFGEFGITTSGSRVDGKRFTNVITVRGEPGDGLGRSTACEGSAPLVRVINGVGPSDSGDLSVDMSFCLRASRPVARGPATVYGSPVADNEADYYHTTLDQTEAAAALDFSNRCGPCCDCDYFVRTYKGLKNIWNRWSDMTSKSEGIRDIYKINKSRWEDQKVCREARPLRLVTIPETQCKVAVGVSYCNKTSCCLIPLQLRMTFEVFDDQGDPAVITPAIVNCQQTTIEGSPQKEGAEPYVLSGEWPVYDAFFDYADPRDVSLVSFRICIPQCDRKTVKVTLSAHAEDPPDCSSIPLNTVAPPSEILSLWGGTQPQGQTLGFIQKTVPLNSASRESEICVCPPLS